MLKLYEVSKFQKIEHYKMGIYQIPTLISLKNNKNNMILQYKCVTDLEKPDNIPRGGYGLVIFYQNTQNENDNLAMKLLNEKYITEIKESNMDSFYKEEEFFKLLNHKLDTDDKLKGCKGNLIEFITSDNYNYDGVDYYFILLKKMDMDLNSYLYDLKRGVFDINLNTAKKIIYQIAKSLDCLHKLGYVYNDLKPENILINKNGECRLTDFNCVTEINDNSRFRSCSTRTFRSPEQVKKSRYGNSPLIDSWQLGLLILCILTKNTKSIIHIISEEKEEDYKYVINNLNKKQLDYYLSLCQSHYLELENKKQYNLLKNMIYDLLNKNIKKRIDISKILTNDFFDFNTKNSSHSRKLSMKSKTNLNKTSSSVVIKKSIKATNINKKGKTLKNKKVMAGNCIFPFKYKGKEYNQCVKDDIEGDWCATSLTDRGYTKTKGFC